MTENRAAVFLDRDGTVIEERDYLSDPNDVALIPGAARAIRLLRDAGLAVVVVTNQSGIARGRFTEGDFRSVQARLTSLLSNEGAALDGTYHCPHHPEHSGPCECRKPGPLLYVTAARDLGLALDRSWYVGDKPSDVEPGRVFGGRGILVRTGYGRESEADPGVTGEVVEDLAEAAERILSAVRESGQAETSGG